MLELVWVVVCSIGLPPGEGERGGCGRFSFLFFGGGTGVLCLYVLDFECDSLSAAIFMKLCVFRFGSSWK